MITEHPVIEHLVVEYATAADVFRLDLSPLDGTDLLAADDTDAFTWTPILAKATRVDIQRGITRDGITLRTETGRATLDLLNDHDLDPTVNPDVRPNAPLRVRHVDGGLIFTGRVEGVHLAYDKQGNTFAQIVAVDAVRDVANTPRYGAANPAAEHELATDRIGRLLTSSPVPWKLDAGLAGPVRDTLDFPLFIDTTHVEEFLDVVDYPDRWPREPVYIPGFPTSFSTVYSNAFARLTDLTPGRRYSVIVSMFGHSHAYPNEYGDSEGLWLLVTTWWHPGATPEPGVFDTVIASASAPDTKDPDGRRMRVDFIAPSSTVYVRAYCDFLDVDDLSLFAAPVYLRGFRLVEHTPIYACNTVHESDLASHLDIATTTARTAWYVDAAGVLQVPAHRPAYIDPPAPLAWFTDDHLGTHKYVGANVGYDTADLVSSVELVNHARIWDAEAGGWRADDRNLGPWEDYTAAATYGQRRETLETTLADVDEPFAIGPAEFAALTLAEHNTPRRAVRSIRWNAAEDYDLAARLEVWGLLTVTHRGVDRQMRILSLEHEVTPTRWMITMTLKEA